MLHYDSLYNTPKERRRVTYPYVWWDNAFTEEELNNIEETCGSVELDSATIVSTPDEEKTKEIRKSKVKFFHRDNDNYWIFNRFNTISQALNNQYYNFNLNGYESFQYTVYDAKEEGNYGWHMDTILDNNLDDGMWTSETRKLTLILLLSDPDVDFTGGELQINLGKEEHARTVEMLRGRIVAFPSFMIHQVKPVTAGIRKSIVVWIEGPKFI